MRLIISAVDKEKQKIDNFLREYEFYNLYRDSWSIKRNWDRSHYKSISGQIEDLSNEENN